MLCRLIEVSLKSPRCPKKRASKGLRRESLCHLAPKKTMEIGNQHQNVNKDIMRVGEGEYEGFGKGFKPPFYCD